MLDFKAKMYQGPSEPWYTTVEHISRMTYLFLFIIVNVNEDTGVVKVTEVLTPVVTPATNDCQVICSLIVIK